MFGERAVARAHTRLHEVVGGRARLRVIVVLALVLALDSADKAAIGADGTALQTGLGIDKTEVGLLLAIASLVGAMATVPAGVLADRVPRTRMIAVAVIFWGVAMLASALATGFVFLVLARVALGCVTAVAGPGIASLIGDYFPERDRGRIYGYVLSGELIGAGFGFVVAGQFAPLSWRAPFFILAAPTVLVWWLLHKLPEPARGGDSRLPEGADEIRSAEDIASGRVEAYPEDGLSDEQRAEKELGDGGEAEEGELVQEMAREQGVKPNPDAVPDTDPRRMSLWQAVRYVIRVRTNLVLIIASAFGYFFFSGIRGFAIEFTQHQYGISHNVATSLTPLLGVGALVGVLLGGRLADRLLRRGRIASRVEVGGISALLGAGMFIPALLARSVLVAVPLLMVAALFLGATNPPLDAARLDIMPPHLWGRAEAIRSVLRNSADAAAPLLFGALASKVFGGDSGLQYTFLLGLIPVFIAAAIVLLIGRRTYPGDVAAAAKTARNIRDHERREAERSDASRSGARAAGTPTD